MLNWWIIFKFLFFPKKVRTIFRLNTIVINILVNRNPFSVDVLHTFLLPRRYLYHQNHITKYCLKELKKNGSMLDVYWVLNTLVLIAELTQFKTINWVHCKLQLFVTWYWDCPSSLIATSIQLTDAETFSYLIRKNMKTSFYINF